MTLTIFILGCGENATSNNEAKTIAEAEKDLKVFSSFSIKDLSLDSITGSNSKTLNKAIHNKLTNQKTTTVTCSDGGTFTLTPANDQKSFNYSYNNCKEGDSSIDGEISMTLQANSPDMRLTYNQLTIINEEGTQYMDLIMKLNKDTIRQIETVSIHGVMNQTSISGEKNNIKYTNFVSRDREASDESWSTIDGTVEIESKCTTGTYTFKTIEKLVDAKDGSEHTESGIFKLNGATYTFENPYVTIKTDSEEKTITQTEFEEHITRACTI